MYKYVDAVYGHLFSFQFLSCYTCNFFKFWKKIIKGSPLTLPVWKKTFQIFEGVFFDIEILRVPGLFLLLCCICVRLVLPIWCCSSNQSSVQQECKQHPEEDLLVFYKQKWHSYVKAASTVDGLFEYVNRTYVQRQRDQNSSIGSFSINDLALVSWRDTLYFSLKRRVSPIFSPFDDLKIISFEKGFVKKDSHSCNQYTCDKHVLYRGA